MGGQIASHLISKSLFGSCLYCSHVTFQRVDLQVGWDNLSCQWLNSIAHMCFQGHFRDPVLWPLYFKIYGATIGSERELQSRSQKVVSNYDIFGALPEMLGKAPVSTRAQFSRSQFQFYVAPFWTPFELHLGSKSHPLVQ